MKYLHYLILFLLIFSLLYFGYHNRPYMEGYEAAQLDDTKEILESKSLRYFDEQGRIYKLECPKIYKKVEDCEWITSN